MAKSADLSEIQTLLTLLIKAMVRDKGRVTVDLVQSPEERITFYVRIAPSDLGKVLGRGGRTANSLRVVLRAVGKEVGKTIALDINAGGDEDISGFPVDKAL